MVHNGVWDTVFVPASFCARFVEYNEEDSNDSQEESDDKAKHCTKKAARTIQHLILTMFFMRI